MTKIDPIIAVRDVNASAKWYQDVFGFKRNHGGDEFAVMVHHDNEVVLCLHKWGEHEHPTMTNVSLTPSNGLILYFRTDDLNIIRKNVTRIAYPIEKEIHLNANSMRK